MCGLDIPHGMGLDGHSDADVAVHAVIDAVLGALALGDIGQWFPDNDSSYKDADSMELLRTVLGSERLAGWTLGNLDLTIMAQRPKLAGFVLKMRENLSSAFACDSGLVSVKATTTEGLGFCGREEGIAAEAVVIMEHKGF